MKKIFYILSLLLLAAQFTSAQKACCPEISDFFPDKYACPPGQKDFPATGGVDTLFQNIYRDCQQFACKN